DGRVAKPLQRRLLGGRRRRSPTSTSSSGGRSESSTCSCAVGAVRKDERSKRSSATERAQGSRQPGPLQLLVQCRDRDAEYLGRARLVSADLSKCLLDGSSLEFLQRLASKGHAFDPRLGIGSGQEAQMMRLEHARLGELDAVCEGILQ